MRAWGPRASRRSSVRPRQRLHPVRVAAAGCGRSLYRFQGRRGGARPACARRFRRCAPAVRCTFRHAGASAGSCPCRQGMVQGAALPRVQASAMLALCSPRSRSNSRAPSFAAGVEAQLGGEEGNHAQEEEQPQGRHVAHAATGEMIPGSGSPVGRTGGQRAERARIQVEHRCREVTHHAGRVADQAFHGLAAGVAEIAMERCATDWRSAAVRAWWSRSSGRGVPSGARCEGRAARRGVQGAGSVPELQRRRVCCGGLAGPAAVPVRRRHGLHWRAAVPPPGIHVRQPHHAASTRRRGRPCARCAWPCPDGGSASAVA